MNLAQMLMTGPKLGAPENRPNPNEYDGNFVRDVLLQCMPGTTKELCEKSGYSPKLVGKYTKIMMKEGTIQVRRRKTCQYGSTRIYERTTLS